MALSSIWSQDNYTCSQCGEPLCMALDAMHFSEAGGDIVIFEGECDECDTEFTVTATLVIDSVKETTT